MVDESGDEMTRAEAVEAFHRASLSFSAMAIEVQGELDTLPNRANRQRLLEAMAKAEHALLAAYYTINDLYFPKGID